MAGTRLFIQEGIYDKFVARLLELLKTWVVGDPFDPNVNQGPQVWFKTSIFHDIFPRDSTRANAIVHGSLILLFCDRLIKNNLKGFSLILS